MMNNQSLIDEIQRVSEEVVELFQKKQRGYTHYELNNQQCVLLSLLIINNSLSPIELADEMKISKSAVSQLLLKLENEGFVIRKKYKNDKRSVTVELDEKGKIYKAEMKEFEKEILKKYYDGFTVTELDNMLELIKKSRDILL